MNKDDREVCVWFYNSIIRMSKPKHKISQRYYPEDMEDWRCCPYCGKPIKIKGDK